MSVTCTNCGGPCSHQNEWLDWVCDRYAATGSCAPDPVARVRSVLTVPAPGTCRRPPPGWFCTLADGHDGPCPTHMGAVAGPGPLRAIVSATLGARFDQRCPRTIESCDADVHYLEGEVARLRAALEVIARPSLAVSTRYGNPHAMVARCQRIAREALEGTTPEED